MSGPWALPVRRPATRLSGESEASAISLGAYWFPTIDSRDDVGFLGSLPLSPRPESKPVTPSRATAFPWTPEQPNAGGNLVHSTAPDPVGTRKKGAFGRKPDRLLHT